MVLVMLVRGREEGAHKKLAIEAQCVVGEIEWDSLMVRKVMSEAVFIGRGCRNLGEKGFIILGLFKGKTRVGCKDMKTKCPECQGTKLVMLLRG